MRPSGSACGRGLTGVLKRMALIALYPGSFDPVTNGHIDVLSHTLRLADQVVVAIGIQASKTPMFPAEERMEMLSNVARSMNAADRIKITTFTGLVVDAARAENATILIRGLRDGTDLDYEMQMAGTNATLAPDVQTVFLPASPGVRHIAATLVRQIAAMGGDVSGFVPEDVVDRLRKRLSKDELKR